MVSEVSGYAALTTTYVGWGIELSSIVRVTW
jgi:hypothetical protein